MKRNGIPNSTCYNPDILEIIPKIRSAVCQHPRLFVKGGRNPCADNSRRAVKERKRRESERTLFGELSRYYQLPPNKKMWTRPPLLERGEHGHDHSSDQ